MAKKKRHTKLNPTFATVGVLVLLILGAFGIQTPELLQDYFGMERGATTQTKTKTATTDTVTPSGNPGAIDHGLATFTKDELENSTNGWITYGKLDGLERATGGEALIKQKMINTGTKANRDVRPPGFVSGLEPYGHSRGHLIGRQFGGSGDNKQNLVTLYQDPVNSPLMTEYENMIRQAVDKGETVRYRVVPVYNKTDLMPSEVHLEAQSLTEKGTINFNITILNKR